LPDYLTISHDYTVTPWLELKVTALKDNRIRVKGHAAWGANESGPNTGDLDFEAPLRGGRVCFTDRHHRPYPYRLRIDFEKDRLNAKETNSLGYFGFDSSMSGIEVPLTRAVAG
jgi:hypothetical protein